MFTSKKKLLALSLGLCLTASTLALASCNKGGYQSSSEPQTSESTPIEAIKSTNGLIYTLSPDGSYYSVTGYDGTSKKVICGDYYKDLPIKEIADNAFRGTAIEKIELSSGITKIGQYAFFACKTLSSVTIPDTVTEIGDYAFSACSSLTNVDLPEGVTHIYDKAFYRSINLISITLPESLTHVGCGVFEGCDNLQYYYYDNAKYLGNSENKFVALIKADRENRSCAVHQGAKVIAGEAFEDCTSLNSVTVSKNVITIGDRAFKDCSSLKLITLPENLETIGVSAFAYCNQLTSVNLPNNLKVIGDGAFSHSGITKIYIPDLVEVIPAYTFNECKNLDEAEMGKGVKVIDDYAFNNCVSLKNVLVKNLENGTLEKIGSFAFANTKALESLTIPASVKEVGEKAFIDSNLQRIYSYHTKDAFSQNGLNISLAGLPIYFYSEVEPSLNQQGTAYDGNYFFVDENQDKQIWVYNP